jgi:hypothetical protein
VRSLDARADVPRATRNRLDDLSAARTRSPLRRARLARTPVAGGRGPAPVRRRSYPRPSTSYTPVARRADAKRGVRRSSTSRPLGRRLFRSRRDARAATDRSCRNEGRSSCARCVWRRVGLAGRSCRRRASRGLRHGARRQVPTTRSRDEVRPARRQHVSRSAGSCLPPRASLAEYLDPDGAPRRSPGRGLPFFEDRVRLAVPLHEVRPALRARVQRRRDGERRRGDVPRGLRLPREGHERLRSARRRRSCTRWRTCGSATS